MELFILRFVALPPPARLMRRQAKTATADRLTAGRIPWEAAHGLPTTVDHGPGEVPPANRQTGRGALNSGRCGRNQASPC